MFINSAPATLHWIKDSVVLPLTKGYKEKSQGLWMMVRWIILFLKFCRFCAHQFEFMWKVCWKQPTKPVAEENTTGWKMVNQDRQPRDGRTSSHMGVDHTVNGASQSQSRPFSGQHRRFCFSLLLFVARKAAGRPLKQQNTTFLFIIIGIIFIFNFLILILVLKLVCQNYFRRKRRSREKGRVTDTCLMNSNELTIVCYPSGKDIKGAMLLSEHRSIKKPHVLRE